ncbi:MAG: hypothetical protein V4699_03420 [Patescibacteria group bacterium]
MKIKIPSSWVKFRNIEKLRAMLEGFARGQFLMETPEGFVFRGEIERCWVGDDSVFVSFTWLCERRFVFVFDGAWELRKLKPKWFPLESLKGPPFLELKPGKYYYQADEDRVKIEEGKGAICHFFRKGDYTNLVKCEDEFIPFGELHKLEFCKAISLLKI